MIEGAIAALFAAFSYATSSNIYSQVVKTCTPIQLNYLRAITSIVIMYFMLLLTADSILPDDSYRNYSLLAVSGFLGIGIGDCFYFKALSILGARKTILLETMAPPFTGLISFFYYGKSLSFFGWVGIFVVAYGVNMVVNEQQQKEPQTEADLELQVELQSQNTLENTPTEDKHHAFNKQNQKQSEQQIEFKEQLFGIACGIAFTFCQALGMVLSHDAAQSGKLSSLQSSLLRIIAGLVCCIIIIFFKKDESYKWPFDTKEKNKIFLLGTLLGPILGIWCQQTSLLYTRPEISQTILATTPLFGLAISWYKGEQMKAKYFVGSIIAILGVCIIIWG
ncbi:integral membrane protein DUF6 containing protein (macronuclear) [Tetrahymena thermophila SB210]|uniref:Integral membrane protein DUF6 containing protein n=1 Tax=Tetrahymena thermophila (strain SB210) TaxID=312017 RepID=I7M4B8_TETTS|nr:integral membrane protein DUF6 containing protein [Tetrahymena thermophila SB210]EAS06179.1 integral membrane protein DUF6 containing protein [Tetrahymena thermophila SB210]|eukprot:XP_001026424.1 integral membrane protein DUF6 containing protein [Tetrahymena thermophila SB210]